MPETLGELYKRCRRYHRKRLLKSALIMGVSAALLGGGVWGVFAVQQRWLEAQSATVVAVPVNPQPAVSKPPAVIVEPETAAPKPAEPLSSPVLRIEAKPVQKEPAAVPPPKPFVVYERPFKEEAEPKVDILSVSEKSDVAKLTQKYERSPSYGLAMKIAAIHYQNGAYDKSAFWAKRANRTDREREDAWLMYAKSEYRLGHKARAIASLKLFLDYKNSTKVQEQLADWSVP